MTELRRTTSIKQIERRMDDMMKLADKQGLVHQPPPSITVHEGPDPALTTKEGRRVHWALDPATDTLHFTLRLSNGAPRYKPT